MNVTSRELGGRRVWTLEAGRWRISVRFGRWGQYRLSFTRDARRAFAGSLPFVAFTAMRRSR